MQRNIFILIIIGIIITGCKQKQSAQPQADAKVQRNFFPVTEYLLGQIKKIDTLPVTVLRIVTINGRADSSWIKREEIDKFVQPFITPAIDSASLYTYFSQRSFLDQTVNAFTFSYDPDKQLPDSIEVKRWDVYVDPDNNNVKRIYILKQKNNDSSSVTTQLTWKTDYYCQVTTISEKAGTAAEIKEEKLIWNFNDED